jgi:hypothetical protein
MRRALPILAATCALATLAVTAPGAAAAALNLSVQADQSGGAAVVTVTATGSSDEKPTSCPAGIGCLLTVFMIRSGTCPAQPATLVSTGVSVVDFLTPEGLPALVGASPGPFAASGDYFLDGAPSASGQGSVDDGYTGSRWGTFIFCGYLQDATATVTFTNEPRDELDILGPGRIRIPYSTIDVFAVTCGSPPCTVILSEHALTAGQRVAGLDSSVTTAIAAAASNGSVPIEQTRSAINQALLRRTLARHAAVELRFTATISDSGGGTLTATRTIVVGH